MKAENELIRLPRKQVQEINPIGILAGCIFHDINNILMAIQGNLSLMRNDFSPKQSFADKLEIIEECLQSARALTSEFISFMKNEKTYIEVTDLNTIIKKIIRLYGRTLKKISIEAIYEKNLLPAKVNVSQIERAVLNLFINAWKAMPHGGDITVTTQNALLHEEDETTGTILHQHYVKISISDTGTGMNREIQNRIFEPFFSNCSDSGNGIGLTSVKRIIDLHRGMIHVQSMKNHGTRIDIFIPALSSSIKKECGYHI